MADREQAAQFHSAEYSSLREEILLNIQDMQRMRNAAFAVPTLVYGSALNLEAIRESTLGLAFVLWVPVVFLFVAQSMRNASSKQIKRIAAYLKEIEQCFASPELQGWEHRHATLKGNAPSAFRLVENIVGGALLLAMILIALYFTLPLLTQYGVDVVGIL
jgi:hypothetical protein